MNDATTTPYRHARRLFFALVVRPLILLVLGLNVRGRERLPRRGPAILVANHNSHLDTLVLMSLFWGGALDRVRPVAAADYFLRNRLLAWFALRMIGILPLQRARMSHKRDPLAGCCQGLRDEQILIVYPEGTRGDPERLGAFKTGVAHLAERFPDAPVIPIFVHGLGKALPRGEALLVPFFCDVFVGEPLDWPGARADFMAQLESSFQTVAREMESKTWL